MSTFKVGEVVIGQHFINSTEYNGVEGVVIAGYSPRGGRCPVTGIYRESWCYMVRWADGLRYQVDQHNLRRKRPPTTGEESIIAMFRKDKQPEGETV